MSEPINGAEMVAEETAPEPTLRELEAKIEWTAHTLGLLFLMIGGHPMDRAMLIRHLKRVGIEFDEDAFLRPRMVMPASAVPGIIKGS